MSEATFSRRVATSFLYAAAGTGVGRSVGAVAGLVALAYLSPADLGCASIVAALFAILKSVTELGLGTALVRETGTDREQVDTLFWLSGGLTLLCYMALFAGAPIVAHLYGDPRLTNLIRVQGFIIPLYTLYFAPRTALERELRFDLLTLYDNLAVLLSAVALGGLAVAGFGPWSLVLAELVNRVVQTVLYQVGRPYWPAARFNLSRVRTLVSFGLYATGSRLLFNFYKNADYLIVGRVFGVGPLGIYTFAYTLTWGTARALTTVLNQVAYPAFARLQENRDRLQRYYFTVTRIALEGVGVVMVVLATYLDVMLVAVGYDKWLPAVPYVRVLALAGVVQGFAALAPQLLHAVGRPRASFLYSLVNAMVMPTAFLLGAKVSLMGVAWAWVLAYPIGLVVLSILAADAIQQRPTAFLWRAFAGLPFVVGFLLVAMGLRQGIELAFSVNPLIVGGVGGPVALVIGGAAAYVKEREVLELVRSQVNRSEGQQT